MKIKIKDGKGAYMYLTIQTNQQWMNDKLIWAELLDSPCFT